MKAERSGTVLMIVSALLWLFMVGLAGSGGWFPALFVLLALLLVYGVLGSSHRGRFDLRLVAFPALAWLVLWAIAFLLGNHYAEAFRDRHPGFTILGFHPSFAAIIVLYWILPTLVMGFGFEAVKDRWLSQERWDEFLRQVKEFDPGNREGEDGDA